MRADDFVAALARDKEYQAAVARLDAEIEARVAEDRAAERPLLDELSRAGIEVESAWDLINDEVNAAAAVPILVDHLDRPYPDAVRAGIARALASPAARPHWQFLVDSYRREQGPQTKDGLAATLAQLVGGPEQLDELITLAHNHANGESRVLLLDAFARSEQGLEALRQLREDPELKPEATRLLRRALGRKLKPDPGRPPPEGGTEISFSADLDDLRRLFRCLGQQVALDADDLGRAVATILQLEEDETAELAVQAQIEGRADDLRLVAEMDDPSAVDLFFYVPPKVARQLEVAVRTCAGNSDGLGDSNGHG